MIFFEILTWLGLVGATAVGTVHFRALKLRVANVEKVNRQLVDVIASSANIDLDGASGSAPKQLTDGGDIEPVPENLVLDIVSALDRLPIPEAKIAYLKKSKVFPRLSLHQANEHILPLILYIWRQDMIDLLKTPH